MVGMTTTELKKTSSIHSDPTQGQDIWTAIDPGTSLMKRRAFLDKTMRKGGTNYYEIKLLTHKRQKLKAQQDIKTMVNNIVSKKVVNISRALESIYQSSNKYSS